MIWPVCIRRVCLVALVFTCLGVASASAHTPIDAPPAASAAALARSAQMSPLVRELSARARQVVDASVSVVSLPSRFSGRAVPGVGFSGAFIDWRWNIHMSLTYAYAEPYARDWMLTHEALHTISPGLNARTFAVNAGWEEGVAEGMRLVIQAEVYSRLGYPEEAVARLGEWSNRTGAMYRIWYAHLERARGLLGFDARTFYGTLFAAPLPSRRFVVRSWVRQRPPYPAAEARFFRELTATGSPLAQPYEY